MMAVSSEQPAVRSQSSAMGSQPSAVSGLLIADCGLRTADRPQRFFSLRWLRPWPWLGLLEDGRA